jgi:hypothetical protein
VPESTPIEVALLRPDARDAAPAPPPARQMVAPSDENNDRPPDVARFESDRDNTVVRESVRPGVPNPAPVAPPRPAVHQHPRAGAEGGKPAARGSEAGAAAARGRRHGDLEGDAMQSAHPPALQDLFASTDELVQAERRARQRAEAEVAEKRPGMARQRVALAVPPVAPEWSLPGIKGTLDHLPDIQRGDVTLLNTKANVFAPFVRRVGERVFQHLIIRQRSLELHQILSAHGPVQMRVLLDRGGKLSSLSVEGRSGSATMDDTLSDALNTAAFDNNPPAAAANADGNYEFMFQAQLRAFEPGEGGLPGRIESRLSVGLL